MWLPADSTTWTSKFKWVEVARYVPKLDRVIREQVDKVPVLLEWGDQIDQWRNNHANTGLYTSVFHYDTADMGTTTRLGSLYFDIDSPDLGEALGDTRKLVEYLLEFIPQESLRIYFTGAKGFHVEAEAIALGIGPSNDLPGLFRFIANNLKEKLELSTLDFAVYDLRRMWRLPGSIHQKTGLYKNEMLTGELFHGTVEEIQDFCRERRELAVMPQVFNHKANEWYREWIYQKETKSYSTQDLIDRFNKFGSGITRKVDDSDREFDPKGLLDNCHAILKHWKTAEETHDLSHEARLFLCSILTYSEEGEFYLHEILKNCSDYNPEKSQAHIQDWKRRRELGIGGRPYSCEKANSSGVGCGDCHLEAKKKWEVIGDRMVETGELAQPSPIRFAYRRKKD